MSAKFPMLACLLVPRNLTLGLRWFTLLGWCLVASLTACTAQLTTLGEKNEPAMPSTSVATEDTSAAVGSGAGGPATHVEDGGGLLGDASDPNAPRLVASDPDTGDTGVEVSATLRLTFDQAVTAGTGSVRLINEAGLDVALEVDVTDSAAVVIEEEHVTISWAMAMGYATWYRVHVDAGAFVAADDAAAFGGLGGEELRFQTESPEAVELLAVFPGDATKAPIDTPLTMVFNVDVGASQGNIAVFEDGVAEPVVELLVADVTHVVFSGNQVDVTLDVPLHYATEYYVVLDSGAVVSVDQAVYGGFDDPDVFAFTTVDPPKLEVVDSAPVALGVPAVDVAPNTAAFVFTFDGEITAGAGSFTIYAAADDALVFEADVAAPGAMTLEGSTLTIPLPQSDVLEEETAYYATLDDGIVVGVAGAVFHGLLAASDLAFTTGAEVPYVELVSVLPANGAAMVSVATQVVLTFDGAIEGSAGLITLYDHEEETSILSVSTNSDAVSISGSTLTLTPPAPLPGSTLIGIRLSPSAVVGPDNAQFLGIADGEYGFTTESSFDLVAFEPTGTGVANDADLVLTFSEDVEVSSGELTLLDGSKIIERIELPDSRVQVNGKVATIDLDNVLAGARQFEVRVEAGTFTEDGGDGVMPALEAGDWIFTTTSVSAPAGVSAGLVLWLDADYSASVKGNANVRLWADRSGQYRNVAQDDVDGRPVATANAINGRVAVTFDGKDDVLRAAELLETSNLDGFVVWRSTVAPSTTAHSSLLVNGANFEVNHGHPLADDVSHSFASCVGNECPDSQWYLAQFLPAPAANRTYVWNFGYNASETLLFARSNAGATDEQTGPTAVPVDATVPLAVGGEPINCDEDCYYAGQIAEVILYSTPLSDTQRLDVTEYLFEKWVAPAGSCGSGEKRGPSGKCYYYSTSAASWANAETACEGRGSGWALAEVRNELDHRFLTTEVLPTGATIWIGAQDGNPLETWRWVSDDVAFWLGKNAGDAVPGAFTVWEAGQPNDSDAVAHCVRYRNTNGTWAWSDGACSESATYVCEGPAE